jgi:adenosylcobyric acid synthase
MIQGTGSGAGKSLLVSALCRIFRNKGVDVAPFKAQNMALNSAIAADGGEIGRAQVLQARAARIEPTVDMNPVLLKTAGERGSQVILRGKVHATMPARDYYSFRDEAWKTVSESYERLSRKYELIVMEGAGSPAEINLLDVDIVNMAMARHAKAPVLLVGDIDKGGVFASLYGTVKLLGRDSSRIKAYIINKFRGDPAILAPGLDMIRERTGKPVIGVLPYLRDMGLPEEDGLALERRGTAGGRLSVDGTVRVTVVRLQSISNFTDFDPFGLEPDVELQYSDRAQDIENADIVILPGSKNTVSDLLRLRERGIVESIRRACGRGVQVIGICGGYQMLGRSISDPHGVESGHRKVEGIGLLDIETLFDSEKTTCHAEAEIVDSVRFGLGNAELNNAKALSGYEIHMGSSIGDIGLFRLQRSSVHHDAGDAGVETVLDGSMNGNCWGTYLHGIFDNDSFRRGIINGVRKRKGHASLESGAAYSASLEAALDRLAAAFHEHVDMKFIEGLIR